MTAAARMSDKPQGYPTILVVGNNIVLDRMADALKIDGYLVLRAGDGEDALLVAKIHSRQIHVVLTDDSVNAPRLSATIQPYRPETRFLLVQRDLKSTLTAVRQVVIPPKP
jgi:hypothetical protein